MNKHVKYAASMTVAAVIFGTTSFFTTNLVWGWVENPWAVTLLRFGSWSNAVLYMGAYLLLMDKVITPMLIRKMSKNLVLLLKGSV